MADSGRTVFGGGGGGGGAPVNMVTTDTSQAITGAKTFYAPVVVDGDVESWSDHDEASPSFLSLSSTSASLIVSAGGVTGPGQEGVPILALYAAHWTGEGAPSVNGNVRLHPNAGDPYFEVDRPLRVPDGVILTSPNDTQYRLVVANDGTLSTEAV